MKHISRETSHRKRAIKFSRRRAYPLSLLVAFSAGLVKYAAVTQANAGRADLLKADNHGLVLLAHLGHYVTACQSLSVHFLNPQVLNRIG
jgi:hypothetical protein